MKNLERVCLSDTCRTIRLPYEAEFGGVRNSNSHVRRSELKLIGRGMRLIWRRPCVADQGRLELNMSCVDREWALRDVRAIGRHLAQQAVWRRVEQPVLALIGAHRFNARNEQQEGRRIACSSHPLHKGSPKSRFEDD